MKQSRFYIHYILTDKGEESIEFSDKLCKLLRERFPADTFFQKFTPEVMNPNLPGTPGMDRTALTRKPVENSKVLLIGIGVGGLFGYRLQLEKEFEGVSLIAVCPPPGLSLAPAGGPRAVLYGSKEGVYSLPIEKYHVPHTQTFGIPSLQHGPQLAFYAIAYLVDKYMQEEDLLPEMRKL